MFPGGIHFHNGCRVLSRLAYTCRIRQEKRAPTLGITWGKLPSGALELPTFDTSQGW